MRFTKVALAASFCALTMASKGMDEFSDIALDTNVEGASGQRDRIENSDKTLRLDLKRTKTYSSMLKDRVFENHLRVQSGK